MNTFSEIIGGLKTALELNAKMASVASALERLSTEVRDIDRRVVRVETIIEITRPDGGTLRITLE